jgi:hypothetical protein
MDGRNVTGPGTSSPFVGAQETDASPERPPPSNGAPADCDKLVKLEQPVFPSMEPAPDSGAAGLMPGVAISVDPSGIPTSDTVEPDPKLSGDVASMSEGRRKPGVVA